MADHAWCHDIARDAAVRASEDNRTAPLPTLGEAIERPFAEAAERSPTVSKTGEGQSGMRTERVVIEIEHSGPEPINLDDLGLHLRTRLGLFVGLRRINESVRVVDETAQAASGGGEGEPVAWMCEWTDYAEFYNSKTQAERAAGDDVVPQPLYRAPPQPRGWLTAEEKTAIRWAMSEGFDEKVLGNLLARSSPPGPEGAKPELPTD